MKRCSDSYDATISLTTAKFKSKPTGKVVMGKKGQPRISMDVRGYIKWKEQMRWVLEKELSDLRVSCKSRISQVDFTLFLKSADRDSNNIIAAIFDIGNGLIWADDKSNIVPNFSVTTYHQKRSDEAVLIQIKY
jgi:Holliday junction resolvase RusA-like endonuclease